jgi:hypothetical protein
MMRLMKMHSYDLMIEELKNMEKIAIVLGIEPFPMYFLGGSACILGKYTERATRNTFIEKLSVFKERYNV